MQRVISVNNQKWGRSGTWINRFRKLRANQKKAQQFYDMAFTFMLLSEDYEKIRLPNAREMIHTFLAHLPLTNPVVEVIPFKPTKPYEAKALKQKEFYQALLTHSAMQTDSAILYAAKDIGVRGEAFLKTVYDIDVIEGMPKEEGEDKDKKLEYLIERMPLKIVSPDPMNCYPSADHIDCRPVEMIEVYNLYAGQIRRVFKDWKSSKKDMDIVVFTEYWSDEKRCFLAEGKPVTNGFEDNPYGKCPYVHVYSGWGNRTDENLPETKAINMIWEAMDLIIQQCRLHAYLDKATAFASIPIIRTPRTREEVVQGGISLTPKPGMVLFEGEEVKIEWAANNLPAGILQAIMLNEARINRLQPGILKGEAPKGIEAGYAMALMVGEARLQFGVPLENIKTLVARALELVRYIVRDVTEDELAIWGENKALTLSSDDCKGVFRIKVDFKSTSVEQMINQAVGIQRLRQGGDISLRTALELNPLVDNPKKEWNRIKSESILKHPALERKTAVDAVREIEGAQAALEIEEAMREGEEGAVRKAKSTGIPVGGVSEQALPEDILAQAMSKRGRAFRGEAEEAVR